MEDLYALICAQCEGLKADLAEAQKKIGSFQKGYLSTVTIKGHRYVYLKRREGKRIVSTYVGREGSEAAKEMERSRMEFEALKLSIQAMTETLSIREKQKKLEQKTHIYTFEEIKTIVAPILDAYEVKEAYLFGSYSRGDATSKSDVDIYFDGGNLHSLLDLSSFVLELQEALGKEVDAITFRTKVHPAIYAGIVRDRRSLL